MVGLTEAVATYFRDGYTINSSADYGYKGNGTRRKAQLWSRRPWTHVDEVGDPQMPTGRFIRGTTETPDGEMAFIGVCIPWKGAQVTTGRKDRSDWEDHLAYLDGLTQVLKSVSDRRVVILGDFNQRIPRGRAPVAVFERLRKTVADLLIARGDSFTWADTAIDHVFHTTDMQCNGVRMLDSAYRRLGDLSDHAGWSVLLASRQNDDL